MNELDFILLWQTSLIWSFHVRFSSTNNCTESVSCHYCLWIFCLFLLTAFLKKNLEQNILKLDVLIFRERCLCDFARDAVCSRPLLTLAAAAASADTHADAAEDDEQQTTCSSCYQNHHIQRIWREGRESVYLSWVGSTTCKLHWGAVALMPLTIHNFQLLGHTALGRPHTVGGLTAIHPCVHFGHAL